MVSSRDRSRADAARTQVVPFAVDRHSRLSGGAVAPIMGDFDTGNVVLKVMDIWGTYIDSTEGNYFDFRGGYYSAGTAP